ncbi:peptidase [Pseudofrankia sp. EUN1h]|nr:peptidase [Pseudofrankia sp. EUN1h]
MVVAGTLIPATTALTQPARASGSTSGSVGIRLVDVPADDVDDPRARLYIVDYLKLGAVIHRRVEVTNKSDAEAHVSIYPGAASVKNGSFDVAPGHTPNELTSWMSLDRHVLTLPPGASAPVTVTIAVPRDASPGERYAGIWAEVAASSTPEQSKGILEVSRVGVRVYLAVGPGGPPPSDFVIDRITAKRLANGRPAVTTRVHNTGGRALDLSGDLTLTDGPGGLSAGPFPARLGTTVGTGQAGPVEVVLDSRLPEGRWTVKIRLRSGLLERTTQATVTLPGRTGTDPATRTSRPGPVLLASLAVVLVVLVGLTFTLLRRKRRSD